MLYLCSSIHASKLIGVFNFINVTPPSCWTLSMWYLIIILPLTFTNHNFVKKVEKCSAQPIFKVAVCVKVFTF